MQICSRCIYDSNVLGISFDEEGVCNYCRQIEKIEIEYGTATSLGLNKFSKLLETIKKKGKRKKYDCVIGVSGGTDSSYMLILAKEWGLRPLAVHYDNTWNTSIATENIRKVTAKLNIDLSTYVVDNKEADDIYRAFLISGVPEFDASTDLALAQILRKTAAKLGIKYILEGHSFRAEGISPQGANYFDGKYIKDIHNKYGTIKMKTYPLMTFYQFLKWILIYRQVFVRPFWYIDYSKQSARERLISETGWEYYGGHHLENRAAAFVHKVYLPRKYNVDFRNLSLAAEVRNGKLDRELALEIYNTPIASDDELIEYVKKRLNLSSEQFDEIIKSEKRSFRDFQTYKKRFETWRPLFKIFAKANLVPMSFYLKYCFPLPGEKK